MITGRMVPATVLIQATLEDNTLTLNFSGMEALHVNIKEVEKNSVRLKTKWVTSNKSYISEHRPETSAAKSLII